MTNPRKANPIFLFVIQFLREFRGETEFDSRRDGRYLRDAKRLIAPEDEAPLDPELVLKTLRAMKAGVFDWDDEITSPWQSTFGSPTYLEQYIGWEKTPPAWYRVDDVALLESITGKAAYPATNDENCVTIKFLPSRPKRD